MIEFKNIIFDLGLKEDETCFIDDSQQHVEGAQSAGLTAFHLNKKSLIEFFKTEKVK